jgi:curved DNA-binding protein CbpA
MVPNLFIYVFSIQVHARFDPYKTLGVSPDANEKEIKAAHRRLVLQHHPDRAHGKEGVEVKFLAIQEAYEILTGKRRGKEVDSGPASDWDFHDWFWRFKFSRRAGAANTAQAPPPPEVQREKLREQLSGLKAKAAAKRAAGPRRAAHAAGSNPSEAAASSVWRSTTKNARKTQQKPAESATVHTAFASSTTTKQERLHATPESPSTTTTLAEEEIRMPQNTHFTTPEASTSTSSSSSTEEGEQQDWRSLLTRAVHHVHNLHDRHTHSVNTHAQRIQSHISSIGSTLSQRLQLHALHELMPELTMNRQNHNFSRWKPTGFRFSASATIGNAFGHRNHAAGAGVPSENELHVLFSNTLNHHARNHEQATATASTVGAGVAETASSASSSSSSEGEWQDAYPRMDAHSRKFADKEHVKSRLTTQLTGLKRKNQLKREFH